MPRADHVWTNVCARTRDAGRRSELRIPGIAAQTRMVSLARIRLASRKSPRIFKRIICDDVSEFESHMPSQAVGSLWTMSSLQEHAHHHHHSRRARARRICGSQITAFPALTAREVGSSAEYPVPVRPRRPSQLIIPGQDRGADAGRRRDRGVVGDRRRDTSPRPV